VAVSRTSRRRGAGSDRDGPPRTQDFLFAYAGADEDPAGREAFEEYREVASRRGARFAPVRLLCEASELARRIQSHSKHGRKLMDAERLFATCGASPFGRPSAEGSNVGRDRGGRVVGIGAAVFENLELRACYVAPAASRKGVGSALVKEIEDAAREQRVPRLEVDSSMTAECFYRTVGYEVVERGEHFLGNGQRMACVRMRKELGA
jgi:ribosomal protein S18 acetylase RimI-like enzyme